MEMYAQMLRQLMAEKSLMGLMESWSLSGKLTTIYCGWMAVKEGHAEFSFKMRNDFLLHTSGLLGNRGRRIKSPGENRLMLMGKSISRHCVWRSEECFEKVFYLFYEYFFFLAIYLQKIQVYLQEIW